MIWFSVGDYAFWQLVAYYDRISSSCIKYVAKWVPITHANFQYFWRQNLFVLKLRPTAAIIEFPLHPMFKRMHWTSNLRRMWIILVNTFGYFIERYSETSFWYQKNLSYLKMLSNFEIKQWFYSRDNKLRNWQNTFLYACVQHFTDFSRTWVGTLWTQFYLA